MKQRKNSANQQQVPSALEKPFKNFTLLKNFIELTDKMLLDYNESILEYVKISEEYIEKLNKLTKKYESNVNQYEQSLTQSNDKIKELIKLFHKMPSIFSLIRNKMKNIHNVIQESIVHNKIDKAEISENNAKFEELKREIELKEKTLISIYPKYETCKNNLFENFKQLEDSLAKAVLSGDNKKVQMTNALMKYSEVISQKGDELVKEKDNYSKNLNGYFQTYDKFFEICESKFRNTLNITKSGITSFASVSLTSFKSLYIQMEQIIKNLSENELNVDYSQFLTNLVEKIDREMLDQKYTLRIINEKYVEDKDKTFDHQKLKREHYKITEDKIYLKNEDIYEIAKMMYSTQLVDENQYNLVEEQKKIKIHDLSDKLLCYSIKKKDPNSTEEITPITDEEVNNLIALLDKPIYRFDFLKILNLFRATGNCEMPKREFEITKNIFLFIAEKIYKETDVLSSKLIIIISQTFYVKEKNEKIYLFAYLQNHLMFTNLKVWETGISEAIQEDLNKSNVNELGENDPKKIAIINNVLLAHTITFCHNMVEFGMKVDKRTVYAFTRPGHGGSGDHRCRNKMEGRRKWKHWYVRTSVSPMVQKMPYNMSIFTWKREGSSAWSVPMVPVRRH